jgi:hypothetical protein
VACEDHCSVVLHHHNHLYGDMDTTKRYQVLDHHDNISIVGASDHSQYVEGRSLMNRQCLSTEGLVVDDEWRDPINQHNILFEHILLCVWTKVIEWEDIHDKQLSLNISHVHRDMYLVVFLRENIPCQYEARTVWDLNKRHGISQSSGLNLFHSHKKKNSNV